MYLKKITNVIIVVVCLSLPTQAFCPKKRNTRKVINVKREENGLAARLDAEELFSKKGFSKSFYSGFKSGFAGEAPEKLEALRVESVENLAFFYFFKPELDCLQGATPEDLFLRVSEVYGIIASVQNKDSDMPLKENEDEVQDAFVAGLHDLPDEYMFCDTPLKKIARTCGAQLRADLEGLVVEPGDEKSENLELFLSRLPRSDKLAVFRERELSRSESVMPTRRQGKKGTGKRGKGRADVPDVDLETAVLGCGAAEVVATEQPKNFINGFLFIKAAYEKNPTSFDAELSRTNCSVNINAIISNLKSKLKRKLRVSAKAIYFELAYYQGMYVACDFIIRKQFSVLSFFEYENPLEVQDEFDRGFNMGAKTGLQLIKNGKALAFAYGASFCETCTILRLPPSVFITSKKTELLPAEDVASLLVVDVGAGSASHDVGTKKLNKKHSGSVPAFEGGVSVGVFSKESSSLDLPKKLFLQSLFDTWKAGVVKVKEDRDLQEVLEKIAELEAREEQARKQQEEEAAVLQKKFSKERARLELQQKQQLQALDDARKQLAAVHAREKEVKKLEAAVADLQQKATLAEEKARRIATELESKNREAESQLARAHEEAARLRVLAQKEIDMANEAAAKIREEAKVRARKAAKNKRDTRAALMAVRGHENAALADRGAASLLKHKANSLFARARKSQQTANRAVEQVRLFTRDLQMLVRVQVAQQMGQWQRTIQPAPLPVVPMYPPLVPSAHVSDTYPDYAQPDPEVVEAQEYSPEYLEGYNQAARDLWDAHREYLAQMADVEVPFETRFNIKEPALVFIDEINTNLADFMEKDSESSEEIEKKIDYLRGRLDGMTILYVTKTDYFKQALKSKNPLLLLPIVNADERLSAQAKQYCTAAVFHAFTILNVERAEKPVKSLSEGKDPDDEAA